MDFARANLGRAEGEDHSTKAEVGRTIESIGTASF
jgi:hypothetical protein